jgi:competence protein ComEC
LSVGVLPLLVLDFHVFQPLSIVLTFAFSVLFDVVLLPLLVLIFALSALTNISLNLNVAFVSLENLVKGVNQLISHPLTLGTPSVPVLLAMFAVTGLLIDFYTHKTKTRAFACFLVLLALFALAKFPLSPSITMVDIGQGDSFLLEDRLNAHTVLIDTGGKVSFGGKAAWQTAATSTNAEKTLIPYLQSRGISALDTVILTHSDADHCGDIIALASKITIREIWVSAGSLTVPDFVMKLKQTHSQIHVVKTGDTFPIFDTSLQVLSSGYTGRGDNNDSIVTYGDFYGTKWLFTGDLERLGEKELLANYPTLQVDVLKAGHHGSKTASDPSFIQQIHPKFALISCGINNRYHHPNEETLATFNTQKIPYIRTDQHGAVRFNGPSWQIETVK